jgi:hypothetical protein
VGDSVGLLHAIYNSSSKFQQIGQIEANFVINQTAHALPAAIMTTKPHLHSSNAPRQLPRHLHTRLSLPLHRIGTAFGFHVQERDDNRRVYLAAGMYQHGL